MKRPTQGTLSAPQLS